MTATTEPTTWACPDWCTADHTEADPGYGIFHQDMGVAATVGTPHRYDTTDPDAHVWVTVEAYDDPDEDKLRPLHVNLFAPGNTASEGDNDLTADQADRIGRALLTAAARLREIEAAS